MATPGEFDADGFSNNLFSDLAPLLALFGEEIVAQFFSMSMGWADNFLLAMGPVGIITIVLSAIRIGGSGWLKRLVGRGRETQAVAEQELLSSTSSSVCELWNGQQIIRLIGEPKGVMTVVISSDGTINTLPQAFKKGIIETKRNGVKNGGGSSEDDTSYTALALPTNLTLNTQSAPAKKSEMWLLAGIGICLQAIATVYPGLATYYFKWNKGDIPVVDYGYPCFAAGTVCLTIGVILCGHIIEGATQEIEFVLSEESKNTGRRILCLQEDSVIGDQSIPSCAIFLAEGDGILRTSRRGYSKHGPAWYETSYMLEILIIMFHRTRAAVPTFLALSGYIVQFVGLRTLHWSATILQLAVTIVMTGVRAWARRCLAWNPETSDLTLQGHEMAWLALLLRSEAEMQEDCPESQRGWFSHLIPCLRTKSGRKKSVDDYKSLFFWELISDHTEETDRVCVLAFVDKHPQPSRRVDSYARRKTRYLSGKLLSNVTGPLKLHLEFRKGVSLKPVNPRSPHVASPSEVYANIASRIGKSNTTAGDRDSEEATSALCRVIENVMAVFCNTNGVVWKQPIQALVDDGDQNEPLQACCEFDIREGRVSEYRESDKTKRSFTMVLQRSPRQPWVVSNRSQLQAAISLSFYTNEFRRMCVNDQKDAAEKVSEWVPDGNDGCFQRIIGSGTHAEADILAEQIQMWLERRVQRSTLPAMRGFPPQVKAAWVGKEEPPRRPVKKATSASYLGMFLSSCSEGPSTPQRRSQELWISERPQVTEAFEYAQELFSIFMLALASQIDRVNGETQEIYRKSEGSEGLVENTVFKSIAEIVCGEKLAASIDEAYVLIIPAFAKHKLLPTRSGPQDPAC
ncbi:hypothetical protein GQ607_002727 [Colletotrichum asianum]|uniref:Uncharacterized protein n=1 Tax=Colletotrichum asianum TaxID=702518 RepID=A0A8H3WNQ6_9PEZI|nr:hypothetical protein GQ607_002727 [Colletotrichum asianum]